MKLLVEHGGQVNSQNDFGRGLSPLSLAIKHNGPDHELVKYLYEIKAEAHTWEPNNEFYEEDEYDNENSYDDGEYDDEDEDDEEYEGEDEEEDEEDDDDDEEEEDEDSHEEL